MLALQAFACATAIVAAGAVVAIKVLNHVYDIKTVPQFNEMMKRTIRESEQVQRMKRAMSEYGIDDRIKGFIEAAEIEKKVGGFIEGSAVIQKIKELVPPINKN